MTHDLNATTDLSATELRPCTGDGQQRTREAVTAPGILIRPSKGLLHLDLRSVWEYRELLYFLTWRDVKVRYKQTAIGAAWAIFQPLITMVIFTLFFGNLARIPSDGLPYSIFTYTALLPWTFFSQAISRCGPSLVNSAALVTKVYFPRLIIPVSAAVAPLVDFGVSFLILLGMMGWFRISPSWGLLLLPVFVLLAFMTALAAGIWLAPLNVKYRDVSYAIPFLVQVWMYVSPVVYPVSLIPERWRVIYGLNPMAGVIEGFRWALLANEAPDFRLMFVSAGMVICLLVGGIVFFKRMERTFADVI